MKKGSVVHRTLHWCFLCQQYKPIKEFYKDKYKSSGFGGICKSCHTNYQREYLHNYYIKHREELLPKHRISARLSIKRRKEKSLI